MPSVYCARCGRASPEGARFCSHCGAPLLRGGGERPGESTSTISLAGTDLAVAEFRRIITDQLDTVEHGREPMNVFRDPTEVGDCIELDPPIGARLSRSANNYRNLFHRGFYQDDVDRYGPALDQAKELMRRAEEAAQEVSAPSR